MYARATEIVEFGPLLAFTACLMNFEKLAHGSPQWTQGAQTHTSSVIVPWDPVEYRPPNLTKNSLQAPDAVISRESWKAHFITVKNISISDTFNLRFLTESISISSTLPFFSMNWRNYFFFFFTYFQITVCKKIVLNRQSVNKHNCFSFISLTFNAHLFEQ